MSKPIENLEPYRRAVRLPHGFVVEFTFSGDGLECAWTPYPPSRNHFHKPKAASRFFSAYVAARDDFITDVATMIGGAVAVVNTEDLACTVLKPGTRQ